MRNRSEDGQELSMSILSSYYRTIAIAMRTDCFSIPNIINEMPQSFIDQPIKKFQKKTTKDIDETVNSSSTRITNTINQQQNSYQQQISLLKFVQSFEDVTFIGNIVKMQQLSLVPMFSQSSSNDDVQKCIKVIFRITFEKQKNISILMRKADYKAHFVRYFNRMLKNRNEKHMFTNLKASYYCKNDGEKIQQMIYFLLQPNSYLLQVNDQFYQSKVKAIEDIKNFKFSNLPLTKLYTIEELDKIGSQGLSLHQIRQRFQQKQKQNMSICGLIEIIEQDFQKKSKKTKQLVFWVYEMVLNKKIQQLGRCKVILRYQSTQQGQINSLIKNHNVYLFSNPEMVITENGSITFFLNNIRSNHCVIKLSQQNVAVQWSSLYNLGSNIFNSKYSQLLLARYQHLQKQIQKNSHVLSVQKWVIEQFSVTPISKLLQKSINRNIIKVKISLLQIQIIYASMRCSICNYEAKQGKCSKQCAKSEILLRLWGAVRGADASGACLLSLQHTQIVQFLQLHDQLALIEGYMREQMKQNKNGQTILKSNKQKNEEQTCLTKIKHKIKTRWVQKMVIGTANMNADKTFREGLTDDEQIEFQNSFQNTKKFLQQKKIFPNGIIQKKFEQLHFTPFIKAIRVFPVQPFF